MAWRIELVSVERVESKPLLGKELPLAPDFPDWVALKRQLQPDDELWTFDSPKRFWHEGMGWRGIVLVRSGCYVAVCISAMN